MTSNRHADRQDPAAFHLDVLEPRLLLDGTIHNIDTLFMERATVTDPGGRPFYQFACEVELVEAGGITPSAVSAQIRTPTREWYDLSLAPADGPAHVAEGEDDDDGEPIAEVWQLEVRADTLEELSDFDDGLYALVVDFGTRQVVTKGIFGTAAGAPLPMPEQVPLLTNITNGNATEADVAGLSWNAVTDQAVNSVTLSLHSDSTGEFVIDETEIGLETSEVDFGQTLPAEIRYSGELAFAHTDGTVNADGVNIESVKLQALQYAFGTFTTVSAIDSVRINRVLAEGLPGGDGPQWVFKAELLETMGAESDSARFQDPGGMWHDMTLAFAAEGDGGPVADDPGQNEPMNEWVFEAAADTLTALGYESGVYTFELTLEDDQAFTVEVPFSDLAGQPLTLPTESPTGLIPSHEQTGINTTTNVGWQVPGDQTIDQVDVAIDLTASDMTVFRRSAQPGDNIMPVQIQDDLTYTMTVSFLNAEMGQTDAGVQYSAGVGRSAGVAFSTGESISGSMTGSVVDARSGDALGGVEIVVFRLPDQQQVAQDDGPGGGDDEPEWQSVGKATSATDGAFEINGLTPGVYKLFIDTGHQDAGVVYVGGQEEDIVVRSGETTADVTVEAHRAGLLYGQVTDAASGVPLGNVDVMVMMTGGEENDAFRSFNARTDASGWYRLYLPQSSRAIYPVSVIGARDPNTAKPYGGQIARDLYAATAGGTRGPDFALRLGASLTGRVVGEDIDGDNQPEPLANRMVFFPMANVPGGVLNSPVAVTDATGQWVMHGVPTDVEFYIQTTSESWDREMQFQGPVGTVDPPQHGWGMRWIDPSLTSQSAFSVGIQPGQLTPGGVYDVGTITVRQGSHVRGRVIDEFGRPVVGANIEITGIDIDGGMIEMGDINTGGQTGQDGSFLFDRVPAGRVLIQVESDNYLPYVSDMAHHTVVGGNLDVGTIVLRTADDSATVWGEISNFNQVTSKNQLGQNLPYELGMYDMFDRAFELEVIAFDAEADWTIEDLFWHEAIMTAECGVEDGFDEWFNLNTAPDPAPSPTDPDYSEQMNWAGGTWSLNLPTGPQLLVPMRQGRLYYGGAQMLMGDPVLVDPRPGQTIGAPDDRLAMSIPMGSATVGGSISFPDGHPGIRSSMSSIVVLHNANGADSVLGRALATANATGGFRMENIPAGTYYLMAAAEGIAPVITEPFTVGEGQIVTQNIVFSRGAVLSGTVTDTGGTPLEGAVVVSETTGRSARTDASGRYELAGLPGGNDELVASKTGYATSRQTVALAPGQPASLDVELTDQIGAITGTVRNAGMLTDGIDNDRDGQTDEAGEDLVAGAYVVAYNETTDEAWETRTYGGTFDFDALLPGEYVLAAYLPGMATSIYPAGGATLQLAVGDSLDLADGPQGYGTHIAVNYSAPRFHATSTLSEGVLSVQIKADQALLAAPTIELVGSAGGTLSDVVTVDATEMQTFTCTYTVATGDEVVTLLVSEDTDNPVVDGSPRVQPFHFHVSGEVREHRNTAIDNAGGSQMRMGGDGDSSSVVIPPFALSGDDADEELNLEGIRSGQSGQPLDSEHRSIAPTYDFVFTKGQARQAANVTLNGAVTITMGFDPALVDRQSFETDLRVGYYDENADAWVWNNIANVNPDSGISDIRVNWVDNTVAFQTTHFTRFASVLAGQETTTVTLGGAGNPTRLTYVDADSGEQVLIVYRGGGSVEVLLSGENLTTSTAGLTTTVGGSSITAMDLSLVETTATDRLIIRGAATIGAVTGTTPLGRLIGRGVTFDGLVGDGLELTGANGYVGVLVADDVINGATISMAATTPVVTALLGDLAGGASIDLGSAARKIVLDSAASGTTVSAGSADTVIVKGSFAGTYATTGADGLGVSTRKFIVTGAADGATITCPGSLVYLRAGNYATGQLTARDMGRLVVSGDFSADVLINTDDTSARTETLTKAIITGELTDADWDIHGNVDVIRAGDVNLWDLALASDLRVLKLGDVTDATIDVSGTVTALVASGWDAGAIGAEQIGTLKVVGGNLGAPVTLDGVFAAGTYGLTKMVVTGWLLGDVTASNAIGVAVVGGMRNANCHAGIAAGVDLPDAAADFTRAAGIGKFVVRGVPGLDSFDNANVAAARIGTALVRRPATAAGGTEFGLAADILTKAIVLDDAGKSVFTDLEDDADDETVEDNFVIRIF